MARATRRPTSGALALAAAFVTAFGGCYGQRGTEIPAQPEAGVEASTARPDAATRASNRTCKAPRRPPGTSPVHFARALPNVSVASGTHLTQAPGDPSRWFATEQAGVIRVFAADGQTPARAFADVSARVVSGGEAGLLSIAFHPQWRQSRALYLSYTGPSATAPAGIESIVSRVRLTASFDGVDPAAPEEIVFRIDQPYRNHNGGQIAFGPDGYLYIGLGDGGSGGDPQNRAQNTGDFLGKILRVDVDRGIPYAVPGTNPFAGGGGRGEIFAYGFRNPWRFSFDRLTGEMWAGDVGQSQWEEIDRVVAGGNYGWRIKEGSACYNPSTGCSSVGLVDPVAAHGRAEAASITGGFVYRGAKIPALAGRYVYGDFGTGLLWALLPDPRTGSLAPSRLNPEGPTPNVSTFAEAQDGELYLLDYVGGGVFTMLPGDEDPGAPFPAALSQTGCVDPGDTTRAAPGVVPYDVSSPLWSDGALKERWFAIPDGTTLQIEADGDLTLPIGSVTMKTFWLRGRRVETRLFVRHADGGWAGYAYAWNDAQTDALLVDEGEHVVPVGERSWTLPSRAQCMQCHTEAAGFTLGLEAAQLDHERVLPDGSRENLLERLAALGYLSTGTAGAARLPGPTDPAPLPARARAYLHANCSGCHRPTSPAAAMDLRFQIPVVSMNLCDYPPERGDLGIADARLVAPRDPARSTLLARMSRLDGARMPPVASHVVDETGVALIRAWIEGGAGCP